jgi:hypothetical protein
MASNPARLAILAFFALAACGAPALAANDECTIVKMGKRINAVEGGKVLTSDEDCNEASFSLPLTKGFWITMLEGQIELTFEFPAPPQLASPAVAKMLRIATKATGRARSNAEWLVRQCLINAAPVWGKDPNFDYEIPEALTRLDQQSFRCGPRQQGDASFEITFHFQDAAYFRQGK